MSIELHCSFLVKIYYQVIIYVATLSASLTSCSVLHILLILYRENVIFLPAYSSVVIKYSLDNDTVRSCWSRREFSQFVFTHCHDGCVVSLINPFYGCLYNNLWEDALYLMIYKKGHCEGK